MKNTTEKKMPAGHSRALLVQTWFLLGVFLLTLLGTLLVMFFVFYIDPLEIYHVQRSKVIRYPVDRRWAVPGVLREKFLDPVTGTYRTAIVGKSTTMGLTGQDLERYAGMGPGLNLAMEGSYMGEVDDVLQLLAQSQKLENVVIGFDSFGFLLGDALWNPQVTFPEYLYSSNPLTRLKALYMPHAVCLAYEIYEQDRTNRDMPGYIHAFEDLPWLAHYSTLKLFSKNAEKLDEVRQTHEKFRPALQQLAARVADTATPLETLFPLPPVNKPMQMLLADLKLFRSDVNIRIFVPPYHFSAYFDPQTAQAYLAALLSLLEKTANVHRVKIFAFDDVPEITTNLCNYSDDTLNYLHTAVGVHRYIAKSIGVDAHHITVENFRAFAARFLDLLATSNSTADQNYAVAFEGPVDEKAFATLPFPYGPKPFEVSQHHLTVNP